MRPTEPEGVLDAYAPGAHRRTSRLRKLFWLFLIAEVLYLLPFLASWGMGELDYSRLGQGQEPLFARHQASLKDGGTVEYEGFGYTLTRYHRFGPDFKKTKEMFVGPALSYRELPFWPGLSALRLSRNNVRLVPVKGW
jgi:hypothetical protein